MHTICQKYNKYSNLDKKIFKDLLNDIILSIKIFNGDYTPDSVNPMGEVLGGLFIEGCNNHRNNLIQNEINIEERFKESTDTLFSFLDKEFTQEKPDFFFTYLEKPLGEIKFDLEGKSSDYILQTRGSMLHMLNLEGIIKVFPKSHLMAPKLEILEDPGMKTIMTPTNLHIQDMYGEEYFNKKSNESKEKIGFLKTGTAKIQTLECLLKELDSPYNELSNNGEIIVKYQDGEVIINGNRVHFTNKKSKIYNIFKLAFDSFDYYGKNKVSYEEIHHVFSMNNYSNLNIEHFNKIKQDANLRGDIKAKNESKGLGIKGFIGINSFGIECQYYLPEKTDSSVNSVENN